MKKLLLFIVIIIANSFLACISQAFVFELQWPQEAGSFKFKSLKGIEVDSHGYIYVADAEDHYIQKFDSQGRLVDKWGGFGFDQGKMFSPSGIAIFRKYNQYEEDDVYIVETSNSRVQKFTAGGKALRMWGRNGSDEMEFKSPQGIAVDSDGNAYVADTGNSRIQKFNRGGSFITSWTGTGDYKLSFPQDIAVDPTTNHVFVADTNNNRILKFDFQGKFYAQWGTYTTDSGVRKLEQPVGITLDPKGEIYVIDANKREIVTFDVNGVFLGKWGSRGLGPGEFESPQEVAVSPDGYLYVTDAENECIQKFNDNGQFVAAWSEYSFERGKFNSPTDMAIDSNDNIYVVDAGNYRIQKFDSNGRFTDVVWGQRSSLKMENGKFDSLSGIAIDKNENNMVYVADTNNSRIQVFEPNGSFLKKWGWKGNGGIVNQEVDHPQGITVDQNGNVYVVDTNNYRIKVFDKNGVPTKVWGRNGYGDIGFQLPLKMSINSKGKIYVVDNKNYCVKMFDKDGAFLGKLGSMGVGNGEFLSPYGVAIDSKDRVYVLDTVQCSIQVFDDKGNFLIKWGNKGVGQGEFISPQGIAIDSKDNIYVADTGNHRIQKFAPFDRIPTAGSIAGQVTSFANANALPDTLVEVLSPDNNTVIKSDRTTGAGTYTVSGVAMGTYTIRLSKPGYETRLIKNVVVQAGKPTLNVNSPLAPASSPGDQTAIHNFPNPFDPTNKKPTNIYYSIPEKGKITIKIYNLAGELIDTVCEDKDSPQTGSEVWTGRVNGDVVPNGVYFCVLKAAGKTAVGKIAVIKE